MPKRLNLIGLKVGDIEVVDFAYVGKKHTYWKCKCVCGNEIIVGSHNLVRGFPKSCGCVQKNNLVGKRFGKVVVLEKTDKRGHGSIIYKCKCDCGNICYKTSRSLVKNSGIMGCGCFDPKKKHYNKNERLYKLWGAIKKRCLDNRPKTARTYKLRGISVCDEWKSNFEAFQDWALKNGYREEILPNGINKWTIDRIDTNGNYEPNNCRFVTVKEQARNTRKNRIIEINGETHCLAEWCEMYNINNSTFYNRLKLGFSEQEAITMKTIKGKKLLKVN